MKQFRGLVLWAALLSLVLAAGCSRPGGLQGDESGAQADQHQVPFHDSGDELPGPTGSGVKPQGSGQKPETGLPFHSSPSLPAGTLLTVRLKNPISADKSGASGTFVAVIDEPITVDGDTLIPSGASAAGRVESARRSQIKRNSGSVRLTLDSIDLAGRDLAVQTSSLFARGNVTDTSGSEGDSSPTIQLEKGRRLTFRLSEPIYLAAKSTIPAR